MNLSDLNYIYKINNIDNGIRNSYIDEMVDDYNEGRTHIINRFDVLINTIDAKDVFINNSETSIKAVIDTKKEQTDEVAFTRTIQVYPHNINCGDLVTYKENQNDKLTDYIIKTVILQKDTYEEGILVECDKHLVWEKDDKEIICPTNSSSVSSYQTNVDPIIVKLNELTSVKLQLIISGNIEDYVNIPNWVYFNDFYPGCRFWITQRVDNQKKGLIALTVIKDVFTDEVQLIQYKDDIIDEYGINRNGWIVDNTIMGNLQHVTTEEVTKEWGYDIKVTDILYTEIIDNITESTIIKFKDKYYDIIKIIRCKNPNPQLDSYYKIGLVQKDNQYIDVVEYLDVMESGE